MAGHVEITRSAGAGGGLQIADIQLKGVYYGNIKAMSGSWNGTMIACTGMDSSGTWKADRQPWDSVASGQAKFLK